MINLLSWKYTLGFPRWLSSKEFTYNAGDAGLICQEDPLEKEMATHSSILAWEIPWTEKPGAEIHSTKQNFMQNDGFVALFLMVIIWKETKCPTIGKG